MILPNCKNFASTNFNEEGKIFLPAHANRAAIAARQRSIFLCVRERRTTAQRMTMQRVSTVQRVIDAPMKRDLFLAEMLAAATPIAPNCSNDLARARSIRAAPHNADGVQNCTIASRVGACFARAESSSDHKHNSLCCNNLRRHVPRGPGVGS